MEMTQQLFDKSRPPKKTIPFSFVLDILHSREPVVKPMFGCYAVYLGPRIVFILRHKADHTEANGVWFATSREHHPALKKEFPSLGPVTILGSGETNWQMIYEHADDFESSVVRACELVVRGDSRIGHIPVRKNKRSVRPPTPTRQRTRKGHHD